MKGFPQTVPTKDLRLSDLPDATARWSGPDPTAPWRTIARFALTFDPAEKDPYSPGTAQLPQSLSDWDLVSLRARLFFEQRRWNHIGRPISDAALAEVRTIVELIRLRIIERDKIEQAEGSTGGTQ